MKEFPRVTHIAMTVKDLAVSAPWYERLFGLSPLFDEDAGAFHHKGYLLPGGIVFALHQHQGSQVRGRFSEFNPGLDHLAFACANRADLEAWAGRLSELGISHSEIEEHSYGTDISFRDPDNIALEFFAPPP